MNPLTALPAKARKIIYTCYAALGVAFGAVQVGYATAEADQPTWLLIAFAVFGYLGTALGIVAAANTYQNRALRGGDVSAMRVNKDGTGSWPALSVDDSNGNSATTE